MTKGAPLSANQRRKFMSSWAPRLSELETKAYLTPSASRRSSQPDPSRAGYRSPWPGGHHSSSGCSGQLAGGEAVRQNFRHAVLHQFHLGRVCKAVRRVFFQVGQRVRAGGERIHQQKAHRRAGDGAQMLHLPDDQIQERILSFLFSAGFSPSGGPCSCRGRR